MRYIAVLALLAASGVRAVKEKEHPIQGVITMLEGLQATAREEGEEEQATYVKYTSWCSQVSKDLSTAISGHKTEISIKENEITGAKKDILTLERNIAKLDKEIMRRQSTNNKAEEQRGEEESDYNEEQSDLTETLETIDTLITAIEALVKAKEITNSGGAAASALLTRKAAKHAAKLVKLVALTQEQSEALTRFSASLSGAQPEKDQKLGGADMGAVLGIVQGLQEGFEKNKLESNKEETEAKNQYNLAKQANDYAISEAEGSKSEKETILGDRSSDLAGYEADLSDEEGLLSSEMSNLKSHEAGCDQKAQEWEVRTKTRQGEIKAMDKAVEILGQVTHVRNPDEHEIPTQEGSRSAASFLQIDDPKMKAVNLLRQVAVKRHSKSLTRLADDIAHMALSKEGPFDSMNNMIQKMIFRLMAEQKDEDEHKLWCDKELENSHDSKTAKDERMEILNTKLDATKADIAELTSKISDNENEVAAITQYVEEETDIRNVNKAENTATIKDASDAKKAVENAISVLVSFYKESGMIAKKPYEFVQTAKKGRNADIELPEEPESWGSSYTGVTDPNAEGEGVVAILEGTGEKFAAMEADSRAQEESDESAYQKDMTSQAMDKAERETDTKMKTNRRTSLSQKDQAMESAKKHLQVELNAVNQYLKDLEPACVGGDSSYDDRKAARADEIEALRKAQNILEEAFKPQDEDEGFLQKRVSRHSA